MRVVTLQEAQEWLVSRISEITQVEPHEIDVRKPFAAYGLSSRETIGLSGDLCDWLDSDISPTVIYSFPDIQALAWHLANGMDNQVELGKNNADQQDDFDPIAIIGIGCRFPGAESPDAFWKLLREKGDAIIEVPPERWDAQVFYDPKPATPGKMNTRWGGFVSAVEQFDADFFSISTREAEQTDPQQRLLLEVSWEALEYAGLVPAKLRGTKTGVFIGIATHDYHQLQMSDTQSIDTYAATGSALSIAANRLSYFYDFHGPSVAIDTACSSSLAAVHLACQSLKNRESDLALAGGVNLLLSPALNIALSQARMMAPDGRCKTFDARADGYVRGEGCGMVILKSLSQATRDGDTILALIRGTAMNQDGHSNGLTAPNGKAQEEVIRQALSNAKVNPAEISYVEAHGTGTSLGDPIEFNTLKTVLMRGRRPSQQCLLGSVKTNIGHLEAAAGIAGLIKLVLSFQHNEIPPILHFEQLNPHISLEGTTFLIPTEVHHWPVGQSRHYAGLSSFSFGGANLHAVLEKAPIPKLKADEFQGTLAGSILCLSAKTSRALQQLAGRYVQYLDEHPDLSLNVLCYSANTGREPLPYRLIVQGHSVAEVRQKLNTYCQVGATASVCTGRIRKWQRSQIAFLCAGEVSRYIRLGKDLYETHPLFRKVLDQCDHLLKEELDRPLLKALYPDAGEEWLSEQVTYTQPMLFAIEYALAQVWRAFGVEPGAVLGHHTGEYVASSLAGVFRWEDGLKLAAARGRLLQELSKDGVEADSPALEAFVQLTRDIKFEAPQLKIISSITGEVITSAAELRKNYQIHQLRDIKPFASGVRSLKGEGYDIFVWLGLDNMRERGYSDQESVTWAPSLNNERNDWEQLQESLGRLWVKGINVNWSNVVGEGRQKLAGLPSYPFQRQHYWLKSKEKEKAVAGLR